MLSQLFAFSALTWVTGSPLLALFIVGAIYVVESQWRGRWWNPIATIGEWRRIFSLRDQVRLNPHDAPAHAELGRLLVRWWQPAAAVPVLEKAAQALPSLPEPSYHLGLAHLALGDTERGKALIDKALALRPDLAHGEPQLALGDHAWSKGDLDRAKTFYESAAERNSSSAQAFAKLGRALQKLGDKAGAERAFDEAAAACDASPAFMRRAQRPWKWRAWLWRRFG